jgi:methylphosphotriester-DNA--protein-cysteine methyltransferase
MYRAFADRDLTQIGHFVMAVKTTGIFCRPGCTARLPRRENVEFFATPRDAVFSGYRACLRCRPMDAPTGDDAPEWLDRLKRRADENPGQRLRDADLREMNLDPSTVRRWFKARYGMTFQAYARARRMGLALAAVRAGSRPELAKSRGGYASDSGFREAFTKLFGSAPKSGFAEAGTRVLSARWIETPLGPMLALAGEDGQRPIQRKAGFQQDRKLLHGMAEPLRGIAAAQAYLALPPGRAGRAAARRRIHRQQAGGAQAVQRGGQVLAFDGAGHGLAVGTDGAVAELGHG